jgi:cell pole-organizing protein PopZ
MEEILASIRQIISEDGEGTEAAEAKDAQAEETGPEGEAEPAHQDDAADAPEAAAVELEAEADAEPAPQFDPEPEPQFEPVQESEPESVPAHGDFMTPQSASAAQADPFEPMAAPSEEESSYRPQQSEDHHLLSAQSDQAVHGAFSALAHTILAQNARTLEDLVAEMLQPMLKSWLDENLPSLVERLVQEEIQRVSRGR